MELKRLVRIAWHRRYTLIGLALVGVAVAAGMTFVRNTSIEPVFRAEAPATFAQEADSLDEAILDTQLANSLVLARSANQDLVVESGGRASVIPDPVPGRILMVALANTAEEAQALAQQMRDNYILVEPLNLSQQIDSQIEQVLLELSGLRQELETLSTPSLEEIQRQSRITRLGFVISLLQQKAADLETERLFPVDGTDSAAVLRDLESVNGKLGEFELELAQLEAQPSDFTELETQRRALERRYADVELTYQELFIQREQLGTPAVLDVVTVSDETPPAGSYAVNGGLGLLLALLVSVGVVLAVDRIRRPVWLTQDVTIMPVLAEVPERVTQASGIWYEHAAEDPRRRAIQAIRVGVEGRLRGRDRSIVFGSLDVDPEVTQNLAADFAVSLASAGRRVCLIDANFVAPSHAPEFAGTGSSLAQILSWDANLGLPALKARIGKSLGDATELRPGMVSIRAGAIESDASDLVASDALPALISEAEGSFDVVVVSSGDLRDPVTQTLCQRVGRTVVTIATGKTSAAALEPVVEDLAAQQIGFLGAVLVSRKRLWGSSRSAVPPFPADSVRPARPRSARPATDRGSRSVREASAPLSRRVAPQPLGAMSSNGGDDHSQIEVTPFPSDFSERLYEWAIDVAMAQERPHGIAGTWSERSPSAVGMLHLVRVGDAPTGGELILKAMEESLDDETVEWALAVLSDVAVSQRRSSWVDAINVWLSEEFFVRHAEETGREPVVWHVASRDRTYEGLVYWRRLDADRIENLRESVIPTMVRSLSKGMQRARRVSPQQSEIIEAQIQDLRLFELALGWLYEGSVADARIWYPWRAERDQPRGWAPDPREGVGPVLAPLQRLGLIPHRVLHSHEMAEYMTTEGEA